MAQVLPVASGAEAQSITQTVPTQIDTSKCADAYTCSYTDQWVPMFPTGQPDNTSTWPEWNTASNYAQIVEEGYKDLGALYMRSSQKKNTGVAINPGMTPGQTYTLGLWAKGTSNSGRVLALYANGDPVVISTHDRLNEDWTYYEITLTATGRQLNLVASDWGDTEIWVDNITLKNAAGIDLLSGYGDFWRRSSEPAIDSASLELTGILNLKAQACNAAGYTLRASVGTDVQNLTAADGVYAVKLPVHRLYETVTLELLGSEGVVDAQCWTMEDYAAALREQYADDAELMALLDALENYGTYAAYYANPTDTVPSAEAVEAVTQDMLKNYKMIVTAKDTAGLKPVASLHLDDTCDLLVQFNAEALDGCQLLVNGEVVEAAEADGRAVYKLSQLLPQRWSAMNTVRVVSADGDELFACSYGVLSYGYSVLGMSQEAKTGLNGLIKAMFLYAMAANDYQTS